MTFDAYIRKFYDAGAHKLLHGQREAYIAQSANTRDGQVAEYAYAREQSPQEPITNFADRRG